MGNLKDIESNPPFLTDAPTEELDVPFAKENGVSEDSLVVEKLDSKERDKERREKRYFSAFRLIIGCLIFLGLIYIFEVFDYGYLKHEVPKSTDSIIEIIKTLLFTLSGYLFARKENDSD